MKNKSCELYKNFLRLGDFFPRDFYKFFWKSRGKYFFVFCFLFFIFYFFVIFYLAANSPTNLFMRLTNPAGSSKVPPSASDASSNNKFAQSENSLSSLL